MNKKQRWKSTSDGSRLEILYGRCIRKNRCAIIVNALREIEASRESGVRLKESERVQDHPGQNPSGHVIRSVLSPPFSPLGERCSRSVRRKRISVFSRRPVAHEAGARIVAGVPLYFHFRRFPRGSVSPYIYLIAPRTTESALPLFPPLRRTFAALAYSRLRASLRLHYTGSFPLRPGVSSK